MVVTGVKELPVHAWAAVQMYKSTSVALTRAFAALRLFHRRQTDFGTLGSLSMPALACRACLSALSRRVRTFLMRGAPHSTAGCVPVLACCSDGTLVPRRFTADDRPLQPNGRISKLVGPHSSSPAHSSPTHQQQQQHTETRPALHVYHIYHDDIAAHASQSNDARRATTARAPAARPLAHGCFI